MDNKIALIMIYGIARTVSIIDLVSRSCYLKVYELMDWPYLFDEASNE